MKIPTNLIDAIPIALVEIFQQKRPADRVIEFYLKNNKKWGSRDRRFFAENVYSVVRNYRKVWLQAGLSPQNYLNVDKINLSSMQKLAKITLEPPVEPVGSLLFAEQESYTDWFDEVGRNELGTEWESIAKAMNHQAPVFLRTNTLKTNRENLLKVLSDLEFSCQKRPENSTAIELLQRKNTFVTKAFLKGFFEVQDLSSQLVAPLLNPQPGEFIVDGCAGAGGKTLHIGALMKNKGRILALDVYDKKLEELRKRAHRAGCTIVETKLIENFQAMKKYEDSVDGVLLDVPCSGSGVIKRNPDTKWKLGPSDLDRLHLLQQDILQSYSKLVKKGGRLVYATCSIFPSENIQQVMEFLKKNSNFKLLSSSFLRPDRDPGDGFFMALLSRDS
jgi:16S rRNA (cytosine967-C5)-methyltransferase